MDYSQISDDVDTSFDGVADAIGSGTKKKRDLNPVSIAEKQRLALTGYLGHKDEHEKKKRAMGLFAVPMGDLLGESSTHEPIAVRLDQSLDKARTGHSGLIAFPVIVTDGQDLFVDPEETILMHPVHALALLEQCQQMMSPEQLAALERDSVQ